jgi:serine/threonine protein kinase
MDTLALPMQGKVLAGKYRIDRTIGEGGMGVVYEAFHLRLRQRVAIKVLRPHILAHPEFVARFEREARAAATLESPYVAKVLDVDTSPQGLPYMVIEFLEGNDLAEELARRGRFPVQEAVALVMEACVPIALAHALGIIHRDLKPSNLFLAKKGHERVLKLLDFGISKVLAEKDAKETSSFQTLGTPHYMSPEHIRSASDVDRRSDIWSLGVILYELLTGTEPFRGDPAQVIAAIVADPVPPPRTRNPDIPEALEAVIMRALEKDPNKRFPDVRAFTKALAPFAPEEELVPLSSVPSRYPPRNLSPAAGIAAVRAAPRPLPETIAAATPVTPALSIGRRRAIRWGAPVTAVALGSFFVAWVVARSTGDETRVQPTAGATTLMSVQATTTSAGAPSASSIALIASASVAPVATASVPKKSPTATPSLTMSVTAPRPTASASSNPFML